MALVCHAPARLEGTLEAASSTAGAHEPAAVLPGRPSHRRQRRGGDGLLHASAHVGHPQGGPVQVEIHARRDVRVGEQGSAETGHKARELLRLLEVLGVVLAGKLHRAQSVLEVVRGAVVHVHQHLGVGVVGDGELDVVLDRGAHPALSRTAPNHVLRSHAVVVRFGFHANAKVRPLRALRAAFAAGARHAGSHAGAARRHAFDAAFAGVFASAQTQRRGLEGLIGIGVGHRIDDRVSKRQGAQLWDRKYEVIWVHGQW